MDKARGNNHHMEVLLAEHMGTNLLPTLIRTAVRRLVGMVPTRTHMEAVPRVHMDNSHHHTSHPIQRLKRRAMASHQAMVKHQAMGKHQVMANMEATSLRAI